MTDIFTIPRLIACGLCGGGVYTLIQLFFSIRQTREILTWPETSGRIVESTTCGKWSRMGLSFNFMRIEEPKITYRYMVNNREYLGHDIGTTGINTSLKRHAEKKIEPFPVGKEITVYYDPSAPQNAVLQKETSLVAFAVFGLFGIILFSLGMLALLGIIQLNI